ncbi:MAG: hypothetical protein H7249_12740, partial [Chitinophagaceae bacterium]|nr:hypothetical protein [Oligoflexus sp.]
QTTQTPPAQGDKPSVPSQTTQTPPAQGDKPSAPSQTTQTPPAQGDKPSAPGQTGQQAGDAATTITYDSTRTDSIAFHAIQLANAALLKISERALFHHVSHDVRSAAKATVKNRLKVSVALPPLAAKVDEVNLVGIPNALDAFKASIHNDYEAVEDSSRSSFEENYVAARNDINRSLVAILVELRTSGFYDGEIAEFVNKNIELSSYESGL